MPRVTANAISKSIKEQTGFDVSLVKGNGYFYFTDNDEKSSSIWKWPSTSVCVTRLSSLTIKQWVEEFKQLQPSD